MTRFEQKNNPCSIGCTWLGILFLGIRTITENVDFFETFRIPLNPSRLNHKPTCQRMDMMSTAMIRVDTLDRFSSEHRAVGYALVAVFMDPQGNQV